ncbi:Septal ring factor EnvC, activator of murein hydrolases AmiA and AmiB [Poseidonocella pacifica]|uniref:Septal ring factor EnvC, activator of murein hydrolases AmiA and AmiB n=1 Tax=Poseidonocella pacifica TaxID=871651 RepID=A0A1I0WBD5_9RHOB|nr:peptidoglycan DD-metalloendopeptidase family protein [Poseidonocella pacifica]SFA85578.1 Septal ring factor EnvC, activator of murein hydrolases AmiA and AmiB [Poseidonocella pacifica]
MIRPLALALLLVGGSAWADDVGEAAARAATSITTAEHALERAESAKDRIRALSTAVRGFEEGLSAVRAGLRTASLREAELKDALEAKQSELAGLLGLLQAVARTPPPAALLHPGGPEGTVQAGLLLADLNPALRAEVEELRADLEEAARLRQMQTEAEATLKSALMSAQTARTELSSAMAARAELPRRFIEDPVKTALLVASADTLTAFAANLDEIPSERPDRLRSDLHGLKGTLPLPVSGTVSRDTRPGILIETQPEALITSPTAATVRYHGPLLDYGNVIILEPGQETLFVLAGAAEVYAEIGQVIPAGHPVGRMGGTATDGADVTRGETLYMEVREGTAAVDPLTWFGIDEE